MAAGAFPCAPPPPRSLRPLWESERGRRGPGDNVGPVKRPQRPGCVRLCQSALKALELAGGKLLKDRAQDAGEVRLGLVEIVAGTGDLIVQAAGLP